ncbi:hypothetical protein CHR53_08340 [Neobacillus mesonae]|uniref:Uncharacterized protein n=1 Tax=Neobacillus mesonae TaxID=1193713 RepID=A0A3T0HVW0_9BACI|nr:hypothetical protein CHR53_08340 [Neobacillus mesonae]
MSAAVRHIFLSVKKIPCSKLSARYFLLIRTKGMGEIFHGQTKGYMFVGDQLHVLNIAWRHIWNNKFVLYFT